MENRWSKRMTMLLLACVAAFLFGVAFVPNIVRADENAAAVSIHVTDSNGAELSGASLSVIGSNGAAKDTWISGSAVHTVDLLPGNYTLEETASPENYSKLDTAFPFTVQEDGTIAAEGLNQEGVIQVTVSGKEITIAAAPLTNDRGASDSSAESTAKIAAVPETAASTFSPEANITQEDVLGDAIE
ncbi:MAG: prealbumin-like fold domain-containing protein, partial [Eubacteriales bacterium]|nr:prealbumin-like fold domain-containing protein [Eubacteriales bacterium]